MDGDTATVSPATRHRQGHTEWHPPFGIRGRECGCRGGPGCFDESGSGRAALGGDALTSSKIQRLIDRCQDLATGLNRKPDADQLVVLRPALIKVTVGISALSIDVQPARLSGLAHRQDQASFASTDANESSQVHSIVLPTRLGRRGNETRLIIQSASQQRPVDQKLLHPITGGYIWREQIASGAAESVANIGGGDGVSRPYVSRLIDLGFLTPDIIVAFANGTALADLSSENLQSIETLPLIG